MTRTPHPQGRRRATGALASALFAATILATGTAHAQPYPTRPVTLVVPNAAGGPADTLARAMARELTRHLGQQVVVENVTGASGVLAAQRVLRSAPDGYTLLFGTTGETVISPLVPPPPGYRTTDFTPIAKVGVTPLALVAKNALGVKDVDALVALARGKPGALTIGISGRTSLGAFAAAKIMQSTGTEFVTVPYRGNSALVPDLLSGQIDVGILALPAAAPLARAGKVTMLGLLTAERTKLAPELPSINESKSVKGMSISIWAALLGPGKLPAPVVERVNGAAQTMLKDPEFRKWLLAHFDALVPPAPAADFARALADEEASFRSLLPGIKLQ